MQGPFLMLRFSTILLLATLTAGSSCLAQTENSSSPETNETHGQSQQPGKREPAGAAPTRFEIAVIRPTDPKADFMKLEFTLNGFTAHGVTCRQLIQEAYGMYEENRLSGGPAWTGTQKFDIEARFDAGSASSYKDLSLNERRVMLRNLLAERFALVLHTEQKDFDAFALVINKGGTKFHEAEIHGASGAGRAGIRGIDGLISVSYPGHLEVRGMPMHGFAQAIEPWVGRTVMDETGLMGRYDLGVQWTPEGAGQSASEANGPTFFTALQEQDGLKLQPRKVPLESFVIDRIESPSIN